MEKLSELVHTWFDRVWVKGDAEYIDLGLSESCEITGLTPDSITSPADFRKFHGMMFELFGEFDIAIDHLMENESICSGVVSIRANHKPTNRPVRFRTSFFTTFENGRISKVENLVDYLSVLIQIKAVPADIAAKGLAGEKIL